MTGRAWEFPHCRRVLRLGQSQPVRSGLRCGCHPEGLEAGRFSTGVGAALVAARPLWMAIVRPYTKTAGILSLAEYPLLLFYLQAGEIPPGQVKAVGGGHVAYPLPAQSPAGSSAPRCRPARPGPGRPVPPGCPARPDRARPRPVEATARSHPSTRRAPSAMARATGSLTAPNSSSRRLGHPQDACASPRWRSSPRRPGTRRRPRASR